MTNYVIGVDYGTESGRVLLVDAVNGKLIASAVIPYAHHVITEVDERIPYTLPPGTAIQDPQDYVDVLTQGIPQVLHKTTITKSQIIGIGFDFTSSTILPVDACYEPLCFQSEFTKNHHAYVKLWKHQLSLPIKDELYTIAQQQNARWFRQLGSTISEEWTIPKIIETFHAAPEIYDAAAHFIEAGDWIVGQLTRNFTKNNCALGFKTCWTEEDGFPSDYFSQVDALLGQTIEQKLTAPVKKIGDCAGTLTADWATRLGLSEGIAVATCIIDAHAGVIGAGVHESGTLLMVMGTSTCHLMVHEELHEIEGISGVVKDSIIPGLYGYEAGQPAVGDLFASFVQTFAPQNTHEQLEQRVATLKAGESGLMALDWHNGTRSILSNPNLSGTLIGLTLQTKPEEIYRAYLEATAYSARKIVDTYTQAGMKIDRIVATGGLPQRNQLLMQIYADVMNQPIIISESEYAPAIGAAILAAVAAKQYPTVPDAIAKMAPPLEKVIEPSKDAATYQQLYGLYTALHDYFGYQNPDYMKTLKALRSI